MLPIRQEAHQAAHRLTHLVIRWPAGGGAILAEAGDRAIDQAGVQRRQDLVVDTQAAHHAGAVILDQHVGGHDQAVQHLASAGAAEVDADGALAAVESGEAGRRVSARPQSEWVAGTGRLDFHHVGAERRQQHAGVRSGDEGGDLDDAHAGEWSSYRGHVERFSMPTDDTLYEPMSLSPGGRGNT